MASVVGHIVGAIVVWEAGRRLPGSWVPHNPWWYLLPSAVAVIPDVDVILPLAFASGRDIVHRGISHSILAAVCIALCAAGVGFFVNRGVGFMRPLVVLLGCALVHPLLDYLMGCGPGVQFLWPLRTQGWLSPVQLIPTAFYAKTSSGLFSVILYPGTWMGILLELLSLGGLWLAIRGANYVVTSLFMIVSIGGFVLTWILYN